MISRLQKDHPVPTLYPGNFADCHRCLIYLNREFFPAFDKALYENSQEHREQLEAAVTEIVHTLENHSSGPYLLGDDFSIVDVVLAPFLRRLGLIPGLKIDEGVLGKYLQKLEETPMAAPLAYSRAMSAMHWGIGGLMLGCIGTVKASQNTQDKALKAKYMNWHKSLAVIVAFAVPARIGLRFASKIPAHIPGPKVIQWAGDAGHIALYGFMIGMPASGLAMGYYSGYGALGGQLYFAHNIMGQALEFVVLAHVGAAAYHTVLGHKIFSRISIF
ncbi:hypothetical protein BCR33DRAFT_857856 [Rhizoclosmatium globosum]|uniref:Cytochrome b561 bacterial/Ni-hydrogenase domain-containing protein n=1 Tax=Rhizoclosmatium globosum TaxID=329046 RepID=A0A1Y2B3G4_9FUNG|nr:hypothetical protein BCR33DRAFT_857856 [Rhizoclosmatium globosum]|eukprot:ORY29100.1 hypothetical protein BCR33DRAFT_857856 [Rhizoclosmatium globosum]